MDASLLELLCCPVTRQPLRTADAGTLRRAAEKTSQVLEEGLVREDGSVLYPVIHGIPVLLPEEGIPL